MSPRVLGLFVVFVFGLMALISCGQEWFPACKDPKHPCPPVEPDYPAPTPFGAARDAGADG